MAVPGLRTLLVFLVSMNYIHSIVFEKSKDELSTLVVGGIDEFPGVAHDLLYMTVQSCTK